MAEKVEFIDYYKPVPGAFTGLTQQEIEDLEREKRASQMIDRQVSEPSRGEVRTITMEATAYCLTTPTATGEPTRIGVVAVDPKVIPLYSKIWVEGYGEAIALDTGADIRGNRVDVWFPEYEQCMQWGRRSVKVQILK